MVALKIPLEPANCPNQGQLCADTRPVAFEQLDVSILRKSVNHRQRGQSLMIVSVQV